MQNPSKDSKRVFRQSIPSQSAPTAVEPAGSVPSKRSLKLPRSAFSESFLAKLRLLSRLVAEAPPRAGLEPAAQREAVLSGPFAVETVERPNGTDYAVVRPDEPLAAGGKAAAVYKERDEALRLAAVLPAVAAAPLYRMSANPKAHGSFTLHRARRFLGHLSRGVGGLSPERRQALVMHLELARYLAANPGALALILESAGPEALPVLGRALARRIEAALS